MANMADGVFQVAMPILVLTEGGPLWSVPAILGAARLPWVAFALHAGVIADRFDRRHLLIVSYLIRGTAVLLFALGAWLGWPLVAVAISAALWVGVAETVGDTVAHTVTPSVVAKQDLVRANGILQSTELSANLLVGPAVAGLIAVLSPSAAVFTAASLYLLSAVFAVRLPSSRAEHSRKDVALTDGLRYLWSSLRLRRFAIAVAFLNFAYALFQSGLPIKLVGTPHGGLMLGLCWALSGVMCLLLGNTVERLVARFGELAVALIGVAGLCAGFVIVGTADQPWLIAIGSMATGTLVLVNVVTLSYRQRAVPDHLLGRVTAAYRLIAFGALPVGSLIAAFGISRFSVQTVLVSAAVPAAVAAGVFLTTARSRE